MPTRRAHATEHGLGRVAVAGASGLVGRALSRQLAADPGCTALRLLLRRAVPDLEGLPKTSVLAWPAEVLPPLDTACCALGTTIAVAGSQAAFRAVDHDTVLAFARAAKTAGARRFGVISALGADPQSSVFYNRVKGEMEAAVRALGFATLVIARPSLLAGDRATLGQPSRFGERLALALSAPLRGLLPARVRPIAADDVAAGLLVALRTRPPGVHVVESAELARLAHA
jgi:uncharacterized protein YbjT (DUF2867 family)